MKLSPFLLDEWLERHRGGGILHDMGASIGPPWTVQELLALGGDEARARVLATSLVYPPAEGTLELRAAIAELHGARPDDVVVTTGAEEALHILFFLAAETGANVVVPDPCFWPMRALPEGLGLQVRSYRLRPEAGFRVDLDEVERIVDARTKLVLVNSPHNPTGAVLSDQEVSALADVCARRRIPLVADEVYHPIHYGPAPSSAAARPEAVVVGDFSKALCLSGLRLGWLIERDKERRARYLRARMYFTISSSAIGEALGVLALRHRAAIVGRAQTLGAENRRKLGAFFDRHRELIRWVVPAGGPLAFPWLTFTDDTRPFAEALAASGVLIVPGDCYGWPRHLRIGFAASTTFDEALRVFERVLLGQAAGAARLQEARPARTASG